MDVWAHAPGGPAFTFSAWGAATLGYSVAENSKGSESVYRWIKSSLKGDPPRRRRPAAEGLPVAVDQAPVRELAPDQAAVFVEDFERIQAARRERRSRRGLPIRPQDVMTPAILYMGHALWPWQEWDKGERPSCHCPGCLAGAKRRKAEPFLCRGRDMGPWARTLVCGRGLARWPVPPACPGCNNRAMTSLQRSHYCLRCSRWGWDPVINPAPWQTQNNRQFA